MRIFNYRALALSAMVLALLVPAAANAQLNFEWDRWYLHNIFDDIYVYAGNTTAWDSSGNVYVIANPYDHVSSSSGQDMLVRKYDPNGLELWTRVWHSSGTNRDVATGIVVNEAMNRVFVGGFTYAPPNYYDYLLVAYDLDGTQQCQATWDGPDNYYDYAKSIAQGPNGNLFIHGFCYGSSGYYDYCTVSFTPTCSYRWEADEDVGGTNGYDYVYDGHFVETDAAGNVYVGGHAYHGGVTNDYDFAVVSYENDGDYRWTAWYQSDYGYDYAYGGMDIDENGNVYLGGYTYDAYPSYGAATVVSWNSSGGFRWVRRWDNPNYNSSEYFWDIDYDSGRVYGTGYTYDGYPLYYQHQTVGMDASSGGVLFVNMEGTVASRYDYGYGVSADANGVYATGRFCDYSYYGEIRTFAYDPVNGSLIGSVATHGGGYYYQYGRTTNPDGAGCVITHGYGDTGSSWYSMATMKACMDVGCPALTAKASVTIPVECNGQPTTLPVDGSRSCDPAGNPLGFGWATTCPAGSFSNPNAESTDLAMAGPPPCPQDCDVTLTVTDTQGNTASDTAPVRVEDTIEPWLDPLPDYSQAVECDSVPPQPPVLCNDMCDPDPGEWMSRIKQDGSCPGNYTLIDTWGCTDACRLTYSETQNLTVQDTTPPDVQADNPRYCLWSPNHKYVGFELSEFPVFATDNCSYPITWEITDCQCDQPDNGEGDGNTTDDCFIEPDGQGVKIHSERAGGIAHGRHCYVSGVATDACNNSAPPLVIGEVYIPHDNDTSIVAQECINPNHPDE